VHKEYAARPHDLLLGRIWGISRKSNTTFSAVHKRLFGVC
jgi:hypothetical protein